MSPQPDTLTIRPYLAPAKSKSHPCKSFICTHPCHPKTYLLVLLQRARNERSQHTVECTDRCVIFYKINTMCFGAYTLKEGTASVHFRSKSSFSKQRLPSVAPEMAQLVQQFGRGWTVRGSNLVGGEIFRTHPDGPPVPTPPLVRGYQGFFYGAWL